MPANDNANEVIRKAVTDNGDNTYTFKTTQPVIDLVPSVDYDNIAVTYPTTTTEQYLYTLSGDTVRTVLVTYATSDKENITNVAFS
jgi:hypothetical protein